MPPTAPNPKTHERHQKSALQKSVLVVIGLGSNLKSAWGPPEHNILLALREINALCTIERVSPLYHTEPQHDPNQPHFLNAVLTAHNHSHQPEALLAALQTIENKAQRQRSTTRRFGPRTLDLDLILWNNLILNTPTLTLPHPRYTQRRFVIEPLYEIAPRLRDPKTHKTIDQLRQNLPANTPKILYYRSLDKREYDQRAASATKSTPLPT